jgi:hypothetical protein
MPDLFDSRRITFREMEQCARRELRKRREVYPRLVGEGRLDQGKADYEIEVMGAIVDEMTKAADLTEDTARTQLQQIRRTM